MLPIGRGVGRGATKVALSGERALALLRLGIGFVWLANLAFIVIPANGFFSGFAGTAAGFGATTLGGPGLAGLVAAYPQPSAWLIAGATVFLAFAFLTGLLVRPACVVGAVFSVVLLVAQWGQTFAIPGGTDVGPHPLYLAAYLAMGLGDAATYYSVAHLGRLRTRAPQPTRPTRATRAAPPSLSPRQG